MYVMTDEIVNFLNEWPVGDDWCMDDYDAELHDQYIGFDPVSGYYVVKKPRSIVRLSDFAWAFYWQGEGEIPCNPPDFYREFKKWKGSRVEEFVSLAVPRKRLQEFLDFAAKINCNILNRTAK